MGGVLTAIEKGWIQREIQDAAYKYQKQVERGEEIVVGVNKFSIKEEHSIPRLRIDPEIERLQVESLQKLRAERNNSLVQEALSEIERIAQTNENLMPYIINAVECYATVGEISNVLRKIFGEYQEVLGL